MERDMKSSTSSASSTFFAGIVMLFVGFLLARQGISDSALYNNSVTAFNWVMRIGGFLMIGVALLSWIRVPWTFILDAFFSALIGLVMVLISLIWISAGDFINGGLVLIFGGMFISTLRYAFARRTLEPDASQQDTESAEPGSKTEEKVGPLDDSEPPPEGFLAHLGRDKDRKD